MESTFKKWWDGTNNENFFGLGWKFIALGDLRQVAEEAFKAGFSYAQPPADNFVVVRSPSKTSYIGVQDRSIKPGTVIDVTAEELWDLEHGRVELKKIIAAYNERVFRQEILKAQNEMQAAMMAAQLEECEEKKILDIRMSIVETEGFKRIRFSTMDGGLLPEGTYHARIADVEVRRGR